MLVAIAAPAQAGSLRFYADVRTNVNRVSIRLDPHVPADVAPAISPSISG
ncbi:MAG: hypothetical protein HC872_02075 [Gammaproteobacteria bacterium]|nr:hypothetical protein [Gammaproteobacteria bacterium]